MKNDDTTNGWKEYKRLILEFRDKTNKRLDDIENTQQKILTQFAIFQTEVKIKMSWRSTLFGVLGAMLPITVMIILYYFKTK